MQGASHIRARFLAHTSAHSQPTTTHTFHAPAKLAPSNIPSTCQANTLELSKPTNLPKPSKFLSPHTRELSEHFPDNPNPDLKLFIQNYPSFTGYALTILCVFITYSRLFPLKSSRRFLYRPECDTSHAPRKTHAFSKQIFK